MRGFEGWTNVGLTGVSSSRLGPPWAILGATACLAMILVAMVGFRSGVFRGALVAVGLVGLTLLFLRTWFILTARTRWYLVARRDLGDLARLALLAAIYVAIPVVGALAGFVLIVVMGALDRIAKDATGTASVDANAPGIGMGFVMVGAIMWFLAYVNHDAGSGSIRAPDPLRRLVRLGDGPIRLSSVALQVVALLLAITGVSRSRPDLSRRARS